MGLLHNGKLYELNGYDKKELEDAFTRFPVKLTFSPFLKGTKNTNGKTYRPKTISIPVRNVKCDDPIRFGVWTYFDTMTPEQVGDKIGVKYHPELIEGFNGSKTFGATKETTNWDLVYFLYFIHPLCYRQDKEGNPSINQQKTKFMFDMPQRDAKLSIAKATERLAIQSQILTSLPEESLRVIAKGMGAANAEAISPDELREYLLKITTDTEKYNGSEKRKTFTLLTQNASAASIYATIQEGVEARVFYFDAHNARWYKNTGNAKTAVPICDVADPQNPSAGLYTYFFANPQEYKNYQDLINEKKMQKAPAAIHQTPIAPHTIHTEVPAVILGEVTDNRMPIGDLLWEAKNHKLLKQGQKGVFTFEDLSWNQYKDLREELTTNNALRQRIEEAVAEANKVHVV